jgi:hypothetical protein
VVVVVGLVVVVVVGVVVVVVVGVVVVVVLVVVVGATVVVVAAVVVVVVVPLTPGVWAATALMPDIENELRMGTAAAPMAAFLRNARRFSDASSSGPGRGVARSVGEISVDSGKWLTETRYSSQSRVAIP